MSSVNRLALSAWFTLAAAAWALQRGVAGVWAFVPSCSFHEWTGLPCPGCGMMRGFLTAFQGRWSDSFHFHPLAIPLLIGWTGWLIRGAFPGLRTRVSALANPRRIRALHVLAIALISAVYLLRLCHVLPGLEGTSPKHSWKCKM